MSTVSVSERWYTGLRSRRSREQGLFALGTLLVGIHVVDELVNAREFEPSKAMILVMLALVPLFPALSAGWQAGLAIGFGLIRLAGSVEHTLAVLRGTPGPSDYTGLVQALGGLILIGVGVAVAVRQRRRATQAA